MFVRSASTCRRAAALASAAVLLLAVPSAALAGSGLKASLYAYRRRVEVRSVVSPRILAPDGERVAGAALDCARHHGHTLETVTAPAEPVPRVLRSMIVTKAVARFLRRRRSPTGGTLSGMGLAVMSPGTRHGVVTLADPMRRRLEQRPRFC